jgi:hypothetical protein
VEPAGEGEGAGAADGLAEFGGVFESEDARFGFGAEVEGGEEGGEAVLLFEVEQVEGIRDEAALDEFLRDDAPEAFEVEGGALGEVFESAGALGGTVEVGAEPDGEVGVAMHGAPTSGAASPDFGEKIEGDRLRRALFQEHLHDGGDDFPCFFDEHRVPDADVFAADFVFVVEGGAGDGAAAQVDGFEFGDGSEGAGSPDLDEDVAEDGLGLFGDELVGPCPAGRSGGGSGPFTQGEGIELDDGAVGFKAEGVADGVEGLNGFDHLVGGAAEALKNRGAESEGGEPLEEGVLGGWGVVADLSEAVEADCEGARGDGAGIEEFEGAGGGVAGVGEGGLARGDHLVAHALEAVVGEIDFAADLEGGRGVGDLEGKAADGSEVLGDVVPFFAIAPGGSEGEASIFKAEGNGEAIDFGFHQPVEGFAREEAFDGLDPFADPLEAVLVGEEVVEGEHGNAVGDLAEGFEGAFPDALGGGIRSEKLGVGGFEFAEFAEKEVVFAIRNGGGGQEVVLAIVFADCLAELLDALFGIHGMRPGGGSEGPRRASTKEEHFSEGSTPGSI